MSNVYRLPLAVPTSPRVTPHVECPRCGALPVHCPDCRDVRTDRNLFDYCSGAFSGHSSSPAYRRDRDDPLPFDLGTDPVHRLCAPDQRVRFGFLWLRRCQEPGVHVHQKCQRCGWRGIALIALSTDLLSHGST